MDRRITQALFMVPTLLISLSGCTQRIVLHGGHPRYTEAGKAADRSLSSAAQSDKTNLPRRQDSVLIWFLKEEAGEMRPSPVERTLGYGNPIQQATDQLLQGPTEEERKSGLQSEIPLGTILIGVKDKGPVTELNLSQRFATGGESSMEARLSQLEKTIKEVAGESKVFLDVEGHRLLTAGEGMEVKQPLN